MYIKQWNAFRQTEDNLDLSILLINLGGSDTAGPKLTSAVRWAPNHPSVLRRSLDHFFNLNTTDTTFRGVATHILPDSHDCHCLRSLELLLTAEALTQWITNDMSAKPPVPSKNALRALRRLALSSSTLLGAVGGVCGLATISYEARIRVKEVEKIVATKRTLGSVSNGRGRAHVARMCEAAERGEDFTLDLKKNSKRRRIRHQSTSAFDQWSGREGEVLALQESILMLSQRPRSQVSEPQQPSPDTTSATSRVTQISFSGQGISQSRFSNVPPLEYRPTLPETHSTLATSRTVSMAISSPETGTRPLSQSNSRSANEILAATQMPLKRESHRVYARQTRQYVTRSPRHDASATAVRPAQAQAAVEPEASIWGDEGMNPGPYEDISVGSDLEQLPLSRDVSVTSAPDGSFQQWPGLPNSAFSETTEQDEVGENESLEPDIVSGNEFGHAVQESLYGFFTKTHNDSEVSSHSKSETSDDSGHLQAAQHDQGVDDIFATRKLTSGQGMLLEETTIREILDQAYHRLRSFARDGGLSDPAGSANAMEELDMLLDQADQKALSGSVEAIRKKNSKSAVFQAMTRCLDIASPSSIAQAEILFYGFFEKLFPTGKCMEDNLPCRRLAATLLASDPTSKHAAYMLFPLASSQIPNRLYKTATDYLYWFCQSTPNVKEWTEETRKVVALAQQRGVPLHERIIIPTVKELTMANKRRVAHKFVAQMRSTDMDFRFLTSDILLRSHAAAGDWREVEQVLARLHEQGLSRSRPIGFSAVFETVLQQYLRQQSLDRAYDYTIHAIANLGLIPTSRVSCTIITACLQQERYDLIQDWVDMMRQMFPFVDPGTGTAMSAWRFSHVWSDRQSSCEEIEAGCRAMAYGAIKDTFSTPLRDFALEAVEQDLRRRICLSNDFWNDASLDELEESLAKMYLPDIANFVQDFIRKHPNPAKLSNRQREYLQDVLRQIKSTTRLNSLFSGDMPRHKFKNTQVARRLVSSRHVKNDDEALLREKVRSSRFPSRTELWTMLSDIYVGRQRRGEKPAHDVLSFLIPQMTQAYMSVDACYMMSSLYQSPYVQGDRGTPFSHDLFELWLHVSMDAKYGMGIIKVIWAIVDSGIVVKPQLLLLVEIAYIKRATNQRLREEDQKHFLEEGKYLYNKLKARMRDRNAPGEEGKKVRFAEFQTWEEKMRMRLPKGL